MDGKAGILSIFQQENTRNSILGSDVSSGHGIGAPPLITKIKQKAKKTKACLNLRWQGSALSAFSNNVEVFNSKIFVRHRFWIKYMYHNFP